jgi:hypothetical protein
MHVLIRAVADGSRSCQTCADTREYTFNPDSERNRNMKNPMPTRTRRRTIVLDAHQTEKEKTTHGILNLRALHPETTRQPGIVGIHRSLQEDDAAMANSPHGLLPLDQMVTHRQQWSVVTAPERELATGDLLPMAQCQVILLENVLGPPLLNLRSVEESLIRICVRNFRNLNAVVEL